MHWPMHWQRSVKVGTQLDNEQVIDRSPPGTSEAHVVGLDFMMGMNWL